MARSTKINPVSADLDRDQYIDGMLSSSRGMRQRSSSPLGTQALSIKSQQLLTVSQIACSTTEAITAMSLAQILRL